MNNKNTDEVLREFESDWWVDQNSFQDFAANVGPLTNTELQLRLLELDLRKRLMAGQLPSAIDYQKHFPHLADAIAESVLQQVVSISKEERPVESRFGTLPQTIGGYEILQYSGRDGVSVWYDAIQLSLSRKVRLRVMLFPTNSCISRACKVVKLEHPNFENMIDVFEVQKTWFMSSQLESGVAIGTMLSEKSGSIGDRNAVRWVRTVADSLQEMHRLDIAHYDVSPSKIFVRHGGEAVLLNPNYENPFENPLSYEQSTILRQNLPFPYRSIPQNGAFSRDPASDDTVALGLVLFQLLTKINMDSFYEGEALPAETERLKKLIADQLGFSTGVDGQLKQLCERTTIGIMDGTNPCRLAELSDGLLLWEKQQDHRHFDGENSPGRPKGQKKKSIAGGFPWF